MQRFSGSNFTQMLTIGAVLILIGGCTPSAEYLAMEKEILSRPSQKSPNKKNEYTAIATPSVFLFKNRPSSDLNVSYFPNTLTSTRKGSRYIEKSVFERTAAIYVEYQNSPFIPLKANLFGQSTSVTLKYAKPNEYRSPELYDITFNDIQNPSTGQPGLSLKDIVEPEVIAKDYSDLGELYPILYNNDDNGILFGRAGGAYLPQVFFRYLKLDDGSIQDVFPPYHDKKEKTFASISDAIAYDAAPCAYLFMDKIGVDKFIFMERHGKQKDGRYDYYKNVSISLYDYMNQVIIDKIEIQHTDPKNMSVPNSFKLFKLFNNFSIMPHVPGENFYYTSQVFSLEPGLDDQGRPFNYQPPAKVTNDGEFWFYLLSDNFLTNYDAKKSLGYTEKQHITFGYISAAGFQLKYVLTPSTENQELFKFLVGWSDGSKYPSIGEKQASSDLKIANGLLHLKDEFGSAYVFNLNQNGIRERKIPSLKIKNNQLSEDEKNYLSVFNF